MTITYRWRDEFTDAELAALHAEGFGGSGSDGWWDRVNQHSLGWVCGRDADQLVGFVNVAWDGGTHAFVLDTVVAVAARRQGVGAWLVGVAAWEARAAGCGWLHVDFEEHLRGFYLESCGFRPTPAGLMSSNPLAGSYPIGQDRGMDAPAAELDLTDDLVDRLVRSQHPDLAGPVRLVANDWDNALFRLGDHLSVRLPRRELAVQLALHEQRWLPDVATRVGVPVPVPVRVGVPGGGYPWPWSITPWYDGIPATDVPAAARAPIAAELADFLVRLHVPAPPDAPVNPVRGVPLSHRDEAVRARLDAMDGRGGLPPGVRVKELRELWKAALAVPEWPGPAVWLHGDPHPANLLLAGAEPVGLAAVLDFGDMAGGDPATDLAAAWLVFDAAGRGAFRAAAEAAGGVDRDTWARAYGWALCMGSSMAVSSDDDPRTAAIGWHTLRQVLLDG